MREVGVALLGLGVVGSGVYKLIKENGDLIVKRTGCRISIKRILVRDPNKKREVEVPRDLLTNSFEEILRDPEVDVVCEVMGGLEPARTYIVSSLYSGRHVVTANKAVLAEYGPEVFKAADFAGRGLFFEASVGGGVPIIKTIRESLAANRIQRLTAIVNGTCNYILTRMQEDGLSFAEALSEAQRLGFAEADPSLDISGTDSAHKLAILATLSYGSFVSAKDVYVEGIEGLEPLDLSFAKEFGFVTKLLAIARESEEGLEVRVHPTLVPEGHMLASVRLAFNAFLMKGNFVGDILLYGLGAGRNPTASAVVADLIDAARVIVSGSAPPSLLYRKEPMKIKPIEKVVCRYFFRFSAVDRPGVLSKISGILGKYDISIASVIQKGRQTVGSVPIVMLTHEAKEEAVRKALAEIDRLDVVTAPTKLLRILED